MLSPYFSPDKKYGLRHLVSEISTKDIKKYQDTKLSCQVEPVFDHFSRHDPLFCFYFRKFLDLYQLLSALKPILIQGIVILLFSALIQTNPSPRVCCGQSMEITGSRHFAQQNYCQGRNSCVLGFNSTLADSMGYVPRSVAQHVDV